MSGSSQRGLACFCGALFICALSSFPSAAQRNAYNVSGMLRDAETQRGVEHVQIELHATDDSVVSSEITRQNGIFEFDNIRPGPYYVVANISGYEPARQEVNVSVGGTAGVMVTVRRQPGVAPADASGRLDISARELALPNNARDALEKGTARLYEKKDPKGSIPYFEKVLKIAPGFYEAHYHIGMAHLFAEEFNAAEAEFRTAMAASGEKYGDAFVGLASVMLSTNRISEAEQSARRGTQLAPNSWQGHLELARALLAEGRVVEAADSAIQARSLKPDYPEIYITLANIHIRLNDTKSLLADVTTYLKLAPDGPYSAKAREIKNSVESRN